MFASSSPSPISIPQYSACLMILLFLVQNIIAAPPSLLNRTDVSSTLPEAEDFMKYLEYQSINKSCIYPPQDIFVSQPNYNHNIVYNLLSEYCSLPKSTEKLSHIHEKYSFLCNELKTITNKLCELGGKVKPVESASTILLAKYAAFSKDPKEFCATFQKNHKDFRLNNMELPGVIEDENKQSFDEFFNVSTINVNQDMKIEHHHHQCENICEHEIKNSTQNLINPLCALVLKGYEIYNTLSDDLTQVAEQEKGKGQPENANVDLNSSGEVQDQENVKDENPLQSIMPNKSKKNTLHTHTDSILTNDEKKTQQQSSAFNLMQQNSSTISQTTGTNTSISNSNNIIVPSKAKNEEKNVKGENIGDNKNVNQNPSNQQQDSKISSSSTAKTIIEPSKEPSDIVNPDEYNPENEIDDAGGDLTIPLETAPAVNDKKESHPDRKQPDLSDKKTTFDQQHVSASSSGDKYYMIVKNPKDRTTIEFAINPESDTNFSSYFLIMIGFLLFGYFTFHHKKRIIAYVIEGKRPQRELRTRRTSTSTSYRKLENNYD